MDNEVTVRSATKPDGKKILVIKRQVVVEEEIDLPFNPGTDVFDLLAELDCQKIPFRLLSPNLSVGKGTSKVYSLSVYLRPGADPISAESACTDELFRLILLALSAFYKAAPEVGVAADGSVA